MKGLSATLFLITVFTTASFAQRIYSSPEPRYKIDIDTSYALFSAGKYVDAIPYLQDALSIYDKSFNTELRLAYAFEKTAQPDECYKTLFNTCTNNWDKLLLYIEQQQHSANFMFTGLIGEDRWVDLKNCLFQKKHQYEISVDSAEVLYKSGQYGNAIPYLETVAVVEDNLHAADIKLAKAYLKTGNQAQCFKVLNRMARDWDWMDEYMNDANGGRKDFESLLSTPEWAAIKKNVEDIFRRQTKAYNADVYKKLRKINLTDQLYRGLLSNTGQHFYTRQAQDSLWVRQLAVDSANLKELAAIFDKYGYPGEKLVGPKYSQVAWAVVQHADLAYQEKYLPVFKTAADKKQLPWENVAILVDRIEMGNGRPQVYGTQLNCDLNNHCTVYQITDEPNVNKRRAAVGLEPLQDYLKQWNINWTPPEGGK